MLVLTRKIGETIIASNDLQFTVLSIKGGQVRVGIHAPESVLIYRGEIYERIQPAKGNNAHDIGRFSPMSELLLPE